MRLFAGSSFVDFAQSLGTSDTLELSRNKEFTPPAEKTLISFLPPTKKPWSEDIKEEMFLLNGGKLYRLFDNNGFVNVDKIFPYDLHKPLPDTEQFLELFYLPIVTGLIRAFNVTDAKFIEKKTEFKRPPGRRFNGMPFSKIEMNFVELRGHGKSGEDHSAIDKHGVRFHFVRGHYMLPFQKTEKVWRQSHWRGDPTLGTVRKIYNAA